MKESIFEKKCIQKLKKLPFSYWPPKGEPGSSRGVSDRCGCVGGRYVSLEFKKSLRECLKNSPRRNLQEFTLSQVQAAGGYATFVYPENWERLYEKIKEIAYGYGKN